MKKVLCFIKNIFVPDEKNMPWVYVSGEGRWIKKKPLSPVFRIGIFAFGLIAITGAGFYFFAGNEADAKLSDLKNSVNAKSDRVIFELKLNPDDDAMLPPVAQNQKAAMPQTKTAAAFQTKNVILPQMQIGNVNMPQNQTLRRTASKAMPQNQRAATAQIKTTVTPLNQDLPSAQTRKAVMPQNRTAAVTQLNNNLNVPEDLRDYWIKIDKGNYTLSLYKGDEIVKIYDVAVGKNPGDKQRRGDHRTPVGDFRVTSIEDSSNWKHDFGDGKGKIAGAYGPWFIRLDAGGWKGIGIHGTHDPDSLGTMASEGCIRMNNDGIRELRNYAYRKMRVVIEE